MDGRPQSRRDKIVDVWDGRGDWIDRPSREHT
jgi:hypothetical protein